VSAYACRTRCQFADSVWLPNLYIGRAPEYFLAMGSRGTVVIMAAHSSSIHSVLAASLRQSQPNHSVARPMIREHTEAIRSCCRCCTSWLQATGVI
jgi:hypothetical protein